MILKQASQALGETRRLKMAFTDRIESYSKVMLGKPMIRGTRITVEVIFRRLSEGATKKNLLDA